MLHGASITVKLGKRVPACQMDRPAVEIGHSDLQHWLYKRTYKASFTQTSHSWGRGPNRTSSQASAHWRRCLLSVIDTCLSQFLTSAEPSASKQNSVEVEIDRFVSITSVDRSKFPTVTTTTYIPMSHALPNATCALRWRPLPANGCLARPHECSQTDAIGWRQRKHYAAVY